MHVSAQGAEDNGSPDGARRKGRVGRRGRRNRQVGQENNSKDLKIVGWNIPGGFKNKWKETNSKNVLCTYDVICLSECWIDKEFAMDDPGYKEFIFPSKSKSTKEGCSTILSKMNTLLTYMYLLWKIKKRISFYKYLWMEYIFNSIKENLFPVNYRNIHG